MSIPKAINIIQKLNPKKLRESIYRLPNIAREEKWRLSYDKLIDALYFTPSIVARDAVLFNVTNEFAIYVNKNSKIEGLFIENFKANFVRHNASFEELLEVLNKNIDDIYVARDKNRSELYEKALEANFLELINNNNNLLTGAKFLST
ncbi:hypothetical protein HY388_01885 [Candidatus Daviesbacteria bacterium]|nr:hypothetical protein [Candidatus Daviesbacteria bacterium]